MSAPCSGGCRDCPVRRAMDRGDADPDGAAYDLILRLRGGASIHGPVKPPRNGVVEMAEHEYRGKSQPTFVRCSDVVSATVAW